MGTEKGLSDPTYNFPQGRVTDHRIGLTLYNLDRAMDGELNLIIEPLIGGGTETAPWEIWRSRSKWGNRVGKYLSF